MRKELLTRLERLEERAAERRRNIAEPPRCAGKPRHIAIADYADWLQLRLEHESMSDGERRSLFERIEKCRRLAAELLESV